MATWNPSDKSSGVTLSNGNLTASLTSGGNIGVRADVGHTTGKWYFELALTTLDASANFNSVGLVLSTQSLAVMYKCTGGVGCQPKTTGSVYLNGSTTGRALSPAIADGDVLMIAVDLDAQLAWFKRPTDANWLGAASGADPVTGAHGFDLSGVWTAGDTIMPCLSNSNGTSVYTANFGATAFSGVKPSGFSQWDGGAPAFYTPYAHSCVVG